jgi:two-component system, LytTR family, response regulator
MRVCGTLSLIDPSNQTPFVALPKESEGGPKLDLVSENSEPVDRFQNDDYVLLTDDVECWIVRIDDIGLLEACRNFTLVHFSESKLLIRRSLGGCESRLDSSIFFRASRSCLVNLSHVIRPRLSEDGGLIFILRDGKEVLLSRRQTALFRATRCL